MEFYYKNVDDGVLVLSADGGLDRGTAEQFVGELRKIIESGASKIIVDCTQLNYVSLHGLRTLFGLHKALAGHGGDVKVAAVQGKIAGLVAESRLSNVFHVYPYVDRARMAFRRGS
ncbi:MAG TPA: STAS domain-containing protein [Vicinamibacteria bacterium]|nr:STAS domain-containing protein [Vicinamibacteria bacterium]